MRACKRWFVAAAILGVTPAAWAETQDGDGLKLQLPSLQGRVRLGVGTVQGDAWSPAGPAGEGRLAGASVLGDYYFGGRSATRDGDSSGFRATSGLYLGSRSSLWGAVPAPAATSASISVERHSFSLASIGGSPEGEEGSNAAVPYLGLGYSSQILKWGLSFSADFGLLALNPGSALRLGRAFGGGQSLDDLLRDLRLSPVVQLGVSYSF